MIKLNSLIAIIKQRKEDHNPDSYTSNLLKEGMPKIAQKIVEEAGELSIASLTDKNILDGMYGEFYKCPECEGTQDLDEEIY